MIPRRFERFWLPAFLLGTCASGVSAADPPTGDFDKAAAILVKNCLDCHGHDDPKGGLDLTRRETLLKGGESGPAIVPGKPSESYLIERVTEGSMPPKKKGQRLSPGDVAVLKAWVERGAQWPEKRVLSPFELTTDKRAGNDWWSLQPVSKPTIPEVKNKGWARNPIDAFVALKLEQRGLSPAPPAEKAILLRRTKFDLLGLPPTPEEIDAFLADKSADAYEKLIDRLLASPHYGERWGRHWLDVVRFGESDGFENDKLRDHAWPYRDYVIRSFNQDKPYTQFIREQLAGDAIQPITHEGIIASAFLVAGPWDEVQNVGQSKLERMRTHEEQMEELIGAAAQTFLGLTVNCARCHDHKFDPIPQTDYYRLKAIFDGVDHGNRPLFTPEEQAAYDKAAGPIRARLQPLQTTLAEVQKKLAAEKDANAKDELKQLQDVIQAKVSQRQAELAKIPLPLVYAGVRRQPEPTVVYLRGDIKKIGPQVTPGALSPIRTPLAELGLAANAPEAQRRLEFADWVAHAENPLTARVMVNRIWQYHFGQGLIENPSDFGFNGGRASHPELLDWLARQFIDGGWSVKKMHRLIMLSASYRQSSQFNVKAAAMDSDNRVLWRFAPRRLEAEIVRDAMLAVSGELNPQMGGPSFRPFTVTVFLTHFYHLFDSDKPEFNRRTVYRVNVNTGRSPFLDALDCPAPSLTMPKRRNTTTPLQALALMNDTFVVRQAERMAQRVKKTAAADANSQIDLVFRIALGRLPNTEERTATTELARNNGLASVCWTLLNTTEFLYVK